MSTCVLCKRERAPASDLCTYHLSAKRNLESGYKKWSEAYGQMAWSDYLRKIRETKETGQWVKEVAELLAKGPPPS